LQKSKLAVTIGFRKTLNENRVIDYLVYSRGASFCSEVYRFLHHISLSNIKHD
jgi:hypothetical protein